MNSQEELFAVALTFLPHLSNVVRYELYQHCGSATALLCDSKKRQSLLPDLSPNIEHILSHPDEALRRAETELAWCAAHEVKVLPMNASSYPRRLAECPDAPVVLYYKGKGDLNHKKIISVVGTRRCTPYGRDIVHHLLNDIKRYAEVMVVSGLAYGIDITAHREALANGLPTVAVLAHGLDMIYPYTHKDTAEAMIEKGGLVTEFSSQTSLQKGFFPQRNRIVAGLADCAILVESAVGGGGLITMRIANDYNREAFAFPGAVTAEFSRGCNNLIRNNGATLITCAEDLVYSMGWSDEKELAAARQAGIERDLFPALSDDERKIVTVLQKTNDLPTDILSVRTNLPTYKVLALMTTLEMKGVVRVMAGGIYHLL